MNGKSEAETRTEVISTKQNATSLEVRVLWRSLKFFHFNLVFTDPALCNGAVSCRNRFLFFYF